MLAHMGLTKLRLGSLIEEEAATRNSHSVLSSNFLYSAAALQCLSNTIFSLLLLSLDTRNGNPSELELGLRHLLSEKLANRLDSQLLPKIIELIGMYI